MVLEGQGEDHAGVSRRADPSTCAEETGVRRPVWDMCLGLGGAGDGSIWSVGVSGMKLSLVGAGLGMLGGVMMVGPVERPSGTPGA
jgi:hypothetical protein